jgi:predicted RNase H-like HicB family nuclease
MIYFLRGVILLSNYTVKYTRINSGHMGQLVEWPEVITEGKTLDECREMLKDALSEMVIAYRQQEKDIP